MKKSGIELISEERNRQVTEENWSSQHDDSHTSCELSMAARCYTLEAIEATGIVDLITNDCNLPVEWPWYVEWWKPSKDPVRNLVKAGALIAAEIDRLQRKRDEETTKGNS